MSTELAAAMIEAGLDPSLIILGHVAFAAEVWEGMPPEVRARVVLEAVDRLGITSAYLPMPYIDRARDEVGFNLVGLPLAPLVANH